MAAQMAAMPQTPTSMSASLPIRQPPPPGSGRSDRTRKAPTPSRSANAVSQPPMGTDLPRENSAIINRIVVDDPQADLAREAAREAEARPNTRSADPTVLADDSTFTTAADATPPQRSRHGHLQSTPSSQRAKFGDYILGQTIGSGEFGKVKMGWKKGSSVQVAIKLIRKDAVSNTNRQAKIKREIDILRNLKHPNIVKLHEYVETERHMGIILEYASGGELFDYILTHRYLKDPSARRLFAQLISGVGYLHSNGIVHRDLKLENLLLDRNKHIIITDFGFANTFNPVDELPDDVVRRITDKDFVKQKGLDKLITSHDGTSSYRRGDLMQTSCGSPCYAAPELVVSDGLYTGRLVDVWSCGVILYAMLAGYLPFDDDPANPDGDNINLLYKYICSTPLTFPEFVTPHARDLLRRILVPEPRQRADLFEVARHSWLSEYAHVVGLVGSKVSNSNDAGQRSTNKEEDSQNLGRSTSVRDPNIKSSPSERPSTYVPKHGPSASMGGDDASDIRYKQQRDAKRNTVQIEPPASGSFAYGEGTPDAATQPPQLPAPSSSSYAKPRSRLHEKGPEEVIPTNPERSDKFWQMQPPTKARVPRSTSDSTSAFASAPQPSSRPNTSGTFGGTSRLPSRGNSYSQPAAAQTNTTTAQGSFSQPKSSSGYIITGTGPGETNAQDPPDRPVSEQDRTGGYFQTPQQPASQQGKQSGHRRSSTLGSLANKMLNRTGSNRVSQQVNDVGSNERRDRRYPPISMKNAMPTPNDDTAPPRSSTDSRRPSFGFSRKASRERDSSVQGRRSTSRRFSWLPAGLSMGGSSGKKEQDYESGDDGYRSQHDSYQQASMSHPQTGRPQSKGMAFGQGASNTPSNETSNSTIPLYYDAERERAREQRKQQARYDKALPPSPGDVNYRAQRQTSGHHPSPSQAQSKHYRDDGYGANMLDQNRVPEPVERFYTPNQEPEMTSPSSRTQPDQYNSGDQGGWEQNDSQSRPQGLRPQTKKLGYDTHGHGGSSNAARKVMNYFRNKRGKEAET